MYLEITRQINAMDVFKAIRNTESLLSVLQSESNVVQSKIENDVADNDVQYTQNTIWNFVFNAFLGITLYLGLSYILD